MGEAGPRPGSHRQEKPRREPASPSPRADTPVPVRLFALAPQLMAAALRAPLAHAPRARTHECGRIARGETEENASPRRAQASPTTPCSETDHGRGRLQDGQDEACVCARSRRRGYPDSVNTEKPAASVQRLHQARGEREPPSLLCPRALPRRLRPKGPRGLLFPLPNVYSCPFFSAF